MEKKSSKDGAGRVFTLIPKVIDITDARANGSHPTRMSDKIYGFKAGEEYNMQNKNYRLGVIVYDEGFASDCERWKIVLEKLNFHIFTYENCALGELKELIERRTKVDMDCFLLTILGYGDSKQILSKDGAYSIEEVRDILTADKCKTLVGKPKLLFVQAGKKDANQEIMPNQKIHIQTDGIAKTQIYKIPNQADFLMVYSTLPTNGDLENTQHSCWLIEALCSEFNRIENDYDILKLLTSVNQYLSNKMQLNKLQSGDEKIYISYTLTKILRFKKLAFNKIHPSQ